MKTNIYGNVESFVKAVLRYRVILCVILIILLLICRIFSNPLRRSEATIAQNIIKLTPIGSSTEEVIKIIEYELKKEIYPISVDDFLLSCSNPFPTNADLNTVVTSFRSCIGEYRNIFVRSVMIEWAFDNNGKLIAICVWKDVDGF